jgi:hypothetical protein
MRKFGRSMTCMGLPALGATLVATALVALPADAATLQGKAVKVGKGTAQVIVETDAAGHPLSVAVSMTEGAVTGQPTMLNKKSAEGGWEYALPMPKGVKTGYTGVMVDWNPKGHPPPHVYTVPHFDFHFYAIGMKDVEMIKFSGPKDPAAVVSDKGLVPPDYQVIPDTVVNGMGVHAIDMTAPELHGKPFTKTFIYGYDKGKLIFLEPMVTQAYLQSKSDVTAPVKTPDHYSMPGYYPTNYTVRYDKAAKRYIVAIGGLKAWK